MDTCALRLAGAGGIDEFQAEATFSICLRAARELPDGGRDLWPRLSRTRDGYEPLLAAFADYLVMELPEWVPASIIQTPLEAARS